MVANIYHDEDLAATLCSFPHLAAFNLSDCKGITLAGVELEKYENLVFVFLNRNTATAPNDVIRILTNKNCCSVCIKGLDFLCNAETLSNF